MLRAVTRSWRMKAIGWALGATAVILAPSAYAHHSFAMFDKDHPVELRGTVKSWEFTNPHSWLVLMVMRGGVPTPVSIEGASVDTLIRQGFRPHSFVPGEKVVVVISPLKNGGAGGAFVKATKEDGTVLTMSPTPN